MTDAEILTSIYADLQTIEDYNQTHHELSFAVGKIKGRLEAWFAAGQMEALRTAADLPSSLIVDDCKDCGGRPTITCDWVDGEARWVCTHGCHETGGVKHGEAKTHRSVVEMWNAAQVKEEAQASACVYCFTLPDISEVEGVFAGWQCIHHCTGPGPIIILAGPSAEAVVTAWNRHNRRVPQ